MRLQLESIDIREVRKGADSSVKDHVLTVCPEKLASHLLQDSRVASVDIEIVYPGESVRIVNLMDVVQPRCKIGEEGVDFPGFVGKIQTAGHGRTRSLRGVAVLVANPDTNRKYSAFVDMAGSGARLSRYSKMPCVVVAPHMAEGTEERDFEDGVKTTGLRAAVYLAQAAEGHAVDETEVFDLDLPSLPKDSKLPRVAYYYQLYSPQHDHRGISDKCFYATDVRNLLPTIIHPNEVLDGGVTGHQTIRSLDTYTIQNHGVITELYRHHGKDLIFAGVVCGVANMEPVQRQRKAMMASNLIADVLGANGAILTKIHGGMPHVDLASVGEACERRGVKTVLFVQPMVSQGTLAETSLFSSDLLDAIIVVGATQERIKVRFQPERILGGTKKTHLFTPDPFIQNAEESVIDTEEFLFAGIHDHIGGANIVAIEY